MIKDLITPARALKLILADVKALPATKVALKQLPGRVLAINLKAKRTQPPFDASAMDGYGVRQRDIKQLPATLNVIGQSAAGHPFEGSISKNQAVRIFTGATVPKNVDTIIIQENIDAAGNEISVRQPAPKGKFIRKAGLDFRRGEVLLKKGHVFHPASIALAASMNHAEVAVGQQPLVAVIASGDELVLPGRPLKKGQIITSNSYALCAMIEHYGGRAIDMGIASDTIGSLGAMAKDAIKRGADIILTMGGASVGDHDLVLPAMQKCGFEFSFSKIAMRPGKPFLFATKQTARKKVRLLGLAGNPVSSIIAGRIFLQPLIAALAGFTQKKARPLAAVLGRNLEPNNQRQEYMRAKITHDKNAGLVATPFESQDSSMLANLTRADCLLIRKANAPAAQKGDTCQVLMLR